ncbi:MAG: hypothetical protein U0835_21685 [Isosphaeraceae bacterium]
MSTEVNRPSASDLLAVKSRVTWGAIAAGAMIALTIYVTLALLGVALGIEAAVRGPNDYFGTGAAIYAILSLLLAMFFGGWAASRLAVGESKLEAVLYGVILWGVLFAGMMWLLSAGVHTGFGAMVGAASGAYSGDDDRVDVDRIARDLERAGADEATVRKYRDYFERVRNDPGSARDVGREIANDPDARQTGRQAARVARQASWWSLFGVLVSLATVITGSLVGSGELLQPVPILGVKRPARLNA